MGNVPTTAQGGFVSVKDVGAEKTPFRDEKAIRQSYWFMILGVMLFIIATWVLSITSYGVVFWQGEDAAIRYLTKKNDDGSGKKVYTDYRSVLISSIAFGAATCVFLIIMIALYFLYLEQNFLFAERLSNELTIASQGPDRLRKTAGLLASYVYPKGQEGARAQYANDLLQKLRYSYDQENKIQPLTPQEYARVRGVIPRNQRGNTEPAGSYARNYERYVGETQVRQDQYGNPIYYQGSSNPRFGSGGRPPEPQAIPQPQPQAAPVPAPQPQPAPQAQAAQPSVPAPFARTRAQALAEAQQQGRDPTLATPAQFGAP